MCKLAPANSRPKILLFLKVFLPGFKSGGPVRSVQGMADVLGTEFDFSVVAYDRDSGERVPYSGCRTMTWQDRCNYRIMYVPKNFWKWLYAWKLVRNTEADVLYLQSFFNPVFTWIPLLAFRLGLSNARRCLIAPRGEFSPGALSIKARRKRLFLAIARLVRLHRNCDWQASSPAEAEQIAAQLGWLTGTTSTCVFIARNLVPVGKPVDPTKACSDANGQGSDTLRVVFLSRLVPMKNLDFAIDSLMHCRQNVKFSIYGPSDQDARYWFDCKNKLEKLPANVTAEYFGEVSPHEVSAIFARHDLFLFPTRGENFGHVIAESLLAGCPVLTSDRTPWRGLQNEGVGWDLALDDPGEFGQIVDELALMSIQERNEQRRRAREFASDRVNSAHEIDQNRQMLLRIANRNS